MGWRWQDWRQGDRLREHLLEKFNRKMMAKQGSTMTRSHEEILRASMGREGCSELWKESSLGVNLRCFFFSFLNGGRNDGIIQTQENQEEKQ